MKDITITTIWLSIAHPRSSWTPVIPILTLDDTKHVALTNACVKICIRQTPYIPQDTDKNMTTKCTEVLSAIIFFPSNHDGKNNDIITIVDIPRTKLLPSIMDNMTPATTIVEECNNEDTGVGPSMAIGNQ